MISQEMLAMIDEWDLGDVDYEETPLDANGFPLFDEDDGTPLVDGHRITDKKSD